MYVVILNLFSEIPEKAHQKRSKEQQKSATTISAIAAATATAIIEPSSRYHVCCSWKIQSNWSGSLTS